ncbi:GNAT family N-acetyltransferase [Streptomyces sp. NPDC037389]|uniref:GNAT family N-acetyltransferase n=1 Tax=Streptomyces sp. NPDC037389 TaxID=3155369 RepID=UPI0034119B35
MFSIEAVNDSERRDVVLARLRATNTERSSVMRALRGTSVERSVPVEVYATGPDGEPAGGLVGHVQWGWLHVDLLWVDGRHRGEGLGSALMARAEDVAREEHGAVGSQVETWDFQAPGFYRKVGYEEVAAVEDYPPGMTNHLLIKRFPPVSGA